MVDVQGDFDVSVGSSTPDEVSQMQSQKNEERLGLSSSEHEEVMKDSSLEAVESA